MRNWFPWYEIRQPRNDAPTQLHLHDDIGKDGTPVEQLMLELNALGRREIEAHIDSNGGDARTGMVVAKALRDRAAPVRVVVDGVAANVSAFVALSGDELAMTPGSQLLLNDTFINDVTKSHGHLIRNHNRLSDSRGRMLNRTDQARVVNHVANAIADELTMRAGGSQLFWRQQMHNRTWYTAEEAVWAGLADRIAWPEQAPTYRPVWARDPAWDPYYR